MRRSARLATRIFEVLVMLPEIDPRPKDDSERHFAVEFEGHLYRVTVTRETER